MKRTRIYIRDITLRRFLCLALSGWLASSLLLFAPIHEFGHLLAFQATGIEARITGWAETSHYGSTGIGLAGGYFFEFFFFLCLLWIRKTWIKAIVYGILVDIAISGAINDELLDISPILTAVWIFITGTYLVYIFMKIKYPFKIPFKKMKDPAPYIIDPFLDLKEFWMGKK